MKKGKTEQDPDGVDQHAPGAKLDMGKPRVGLMFQGFSRALMEVAKVTTHGADKYSPHGWLDVNNGAERFNDAKCRHLLKGCQEHWDKESRLLHLAQEAWNILAELELMLRRSND